VSSTFIGMGRRKGAGEEKAFNDKIMRVNHSARVHHRGCYYFRRSQINIQVVSCRGNIFLPSLISSHPFSFLFFEKERSNALTVCLSRVKAPFRVYAIIGAGHACLRFAFDHS